MNHTVSEGEAENSPPVRSGTRPLHSHTNIRLKLIGHTDHKNSVPESLCKPVRW